MPTSCVGRYPSPFPRGAPLTLVRIEFYKKVTLAHYERDDRWALLADQQTGAKTIEHREIYRDPDNRRTISEQARIYSLEEFGSIEISAQLQVKLAAAIEEASRLSNPH